MHNRFRHNTRQVIFRSSRHRGFTLTEIFFITLIILIVSSFIYTNYIGLVESGYRQRARIDLKNISKHCIIFHNANKQWPSSIIDLKQHLEASYELRKDTAAFNMLAQSTHEMSLNDPWGNFYQIDPFFGRAVTRGGNGVLEIPFGGADRENGLGWGARIIDGGNWPGTFDPRVVDDYFESFNDSGFYFSSDRFGNSEICFMSAGKIEVHDLSSHPSEDHSPCPSPDGQSIAFCSNRTVNYEIHTMKADGSYQTSVTSNGADNQHPSFSPDGQWIVFSSNLDGDYDIYLMSSDGSGITNITGSSNQDVQPSFSPDSDKIIFSSDRSGNSDIFTIFPDGTNLQQITFDSSDDYAPCFSPDSRLIVFCSTRNGTPQIFLMDAGGNSVVSLFAGAEDGYSPCFTPDGGRILFHSSRDGNSEIYMMNLDGSNQTNLTSSPGSDYSPRATM
ncbi:MAG: hypothetical protein PHQ23_05080 [Candidatus Wallbacteria bacterium]|nr:hypothetical protein [Candidatus Wallbacteria bacterium]